MPDNLNISIGADTSRLRGEIKLATAELQNLGRQVNAAVKAGDTARAKELSATFGVMQTNLAGLSKELAVTTGSMTNLGRSTALTQRSFRSFEGAIFGLGKSVGGLNAGLIAFAAFRGFEAIKTQLDEFSKTLGELKKTAGEIGIRPIQLQGAQRAVGAIGEEADIATKALQGMNAQFEELRKNPPRAGAAGAGSAFGVQVSRGGEASPADFSKPLQMLHIEQQIAAILPSRTANLEKQTLALRAFVQQARNFDPTALNIISKTLFGGVPANSMLEVAPALLRTWQQEIEKLKQSSAGATAAALEEDKKLLVSKNKLANAWTDAMASLATTARPAQIAINDIITRFLNESAFSANLEDAKKKWRLFWSGTTDIAKEGAAKVNNVLREIEVNPPGMPQVFRGPGRGEDSGHGPPSGDTGTAGHGPGSRATQSTTPGTSDYQALPPHVVYPMLQAAGEAAESSRTAAEKSADAAAAAQSAAEASRTAVDAWVNSSVNAGFARGGLVSGPGSGTSDSILARLSAGEFVINSGAVRRLGISYLSGLNGFADGGLVGLPRFAAGGLVTAAAGGTPVHLHLGGGSFALSGNDHVVTALVAEAQRQQMRSAGTKPSWFAGRPSGR